MRIIGPSRIISNESFYLSKKEDMKGNVIPFKKNTTRAPSDIFKDFTAIKSDPNNFMKVKALQEKTYKNMNLHSNEASVIELLNNFTIAIGTLDGCLIVWDSEKNIKIIDEIAHEARINDIKAIDNKTFVTCSVDTAIKVWNLGLKICEYELYAYSNIVCILHLNNNLIACAGDESHISIWNIFENKIIFCLNGHKLSVNSLVLIDENLIASSSQDCKILIWNWKKKEIHKKIVCDEVPNKLQVPLNQKGLLLANFHQKIKIYDFKTQQILVVFENDIFPNVSVVCLDFNIFVSCNSKNVLNFFDLDKFSLIKSKKIKSQANIINILRIDKFNIAINLSDRKIEFFDYIKFLMD